MVLAFLCNRFFNLDMEWSNLNSLKINNIRYRAEFKNQLPPVSLKDLQLKKPKESKDWSNFIILNLLRAIAVDVRVILSIS